MNEHPYKKHEGTDLWQSLEKSLKELSDNQDINITANPIHVIGYLCQQICNLENFG